MILVDIGNLSFQELKYLAKQEGVEDYDSLSKDDLIDELSDIFDIVDGTIQLNNRLQNTSGQRYVNALSDSATTRDVQDLPGVEELTELYMETSIHFMLSDLSWGFAYWSISPLSKAKLLEEDETYLSNVFLRVTSTNNETQETTYYDISVDKDDTCWSINLAELGCTYQVSLCVQNNAGIIVALAQSIAISVPLPYWFKHSQELEKNPVLFNSSFSSIITKQGEYKDTLVVKSVITKLAHGDNDGKY
ncbi:MAG: DUF4912 domain-containing protein [Spirochaetia bacterium]|nr:DUF4912 domain-containing protein [Spirochaetia bacterium]